MCRWCSLAQDTFESFRGDNGRHITIDQNAFVEHLLPGGILRKLSQQEHDYYCRPFLEPAAREPVYRWPNQIPIKGEPEDVQGIVQKYHDWLLDTELPKIMFWATPGVFVPQEKAERYLDRLKNVTGVFVGQGSHWLQEDHPRLIGMEIARWLAKNK
jgi:haloalkane dehalogenase